MTYRHLVVRRDGPVAHVTLNRPAVRNALNSEVIAELGRWADEMRGDSRTRAAVLSGAGPVFSAGADVDWMARSLEFSAEENVADAEQLSRMLSVLDRLPVPLFGRVQGAALGGGAGLAAVCDVVVAADDTVFGFTEVKLGIVPAVISPFVLAKIGRSAARELFLTGSRFTAPRAKEIGLVHAVVPEAQLDEVLRERLLDVLAAGPHAVRAAKSLVEQVWNLPAAEATRLTARVIAARRVSPEGQEGLRAFLERRKPSWQED
jgi:methylglutaconyl-CoA hydratase